MDSAAKGVETAQDIGLYLPLEFAEPVGDLRTLVRLGPRLELQRWLLAIPMRAEVRLLCAALR
ncbi:hypothetical protein G3480_11240 [Thiorhodococcus mannitoliphagus]|uniref:Uncharacterized protein n=1 Tax=Thiorhodococcus mannitoliphagus TaxID=329406 RepID=A0A6P1DST8_9GAMM|nr:hypothetical protein [Thiorhodococcus mannitoliphagus]